MVAGGVLIPGSWLEGLHASRFAGAAMADLRTEIADLQDQSVTLKQQDSGVLQRLALNEQDQHDVTQRLGALELTVPRLQEAVNALPAGVDQATITGDITGAPQTRTQAADGGTVTVSTSPLSTGPANTTGAQQAMPRALDPPVEAQGTFGIALGSPLDEVDGPAQWRAISDKAGTLLLGLTPLLGPIDGSAQRRLVVGPLPTEAAARELCGSFAQLGVACLTAPYTGLALGN